MFFKTLNVEPCSCSGCSDSLMLLTPSLPDSWAFETQVGLGSAAVHRHAPDPPLTSLRILGLLGFTGFVTVGWVWG